MLLFFLLASERWLVSRTVEAISKRRSRVAVIGAVRAAQRDIAAFLATQALINTGVALATGLACWAIGLPNPVLWGALAGIMSFIPYLGPIVTLLTLFLAGAVTVHRSTVSGRRQKRGTALEKPASLDDLSRPWPGGAAQPAVPAGPPAPAAHAYRRTRSAKYWRCLCVGDAAAQSSHVTRRLRKTRSLRLRV
jgi:hypothetical protein